MADTDKEKLDQINKVISKDEYNEIWQQLVNDVRMGLTGALKSSLPLEYNVFMRLSVLIMKRLITRAPQLLIALSYIKKSRKFDSFFTK